jgi:hypothetical protein
MGFSTTFSHFIPLQKYGKYIKSQTLFLRAEKIIPGGSVTEKSRSKPALL